MENNESSWDPLQELSDLIEEAGLVLYFTPPPEHQKKAGCTCSWPDGYPGRPKLNPRCKVHAWVLPAQAKKHAAITLPLERWDDDGGKVEPII
jgi:hypothetical protein